MPRLRTRTRAALWTASLTVVVMAAVFIAAVKFRESDDINHVAGHLIFALPSALAATGIWWLWRPRPSLFERGARFAVVAALSIFAGSLLVEAISTFGLWWLHNPAANVTNPMVLVVPATFLLALLALLLRLGSVILGKISQKRGSQAHH